MRLILNEYEQLPLSHTQLIMFSKAENFCGNLHFLLLTETDGNGQLNISMQQLATSFDLVLKIFINAPRTV